MYALSYGIDPRVPTFLIVTSMTLRFASAPLVTALIHVATTTANYNGIARRTLHFVVSIFLVPLTYLFREERERRKYK